MEVYFSPSPTSIVVLRATTQTLLSTNWTIQLESSFLYQTIDTTGAYDIEYFTISGKHYLAVANRQNGATPQLNSVIY